MKQRRCELCEKPAKMYCESDRANLCWDCDRKVHGANFLVARHSRALLCHACQNPTPWRASGSKLTPSVSVCGDCVAASGRAESTSELGECNRGGPGYHGGDSSDDDDDEDEDDEDEDEDDEDDEQRKEEEDDGDDEENQVVPWDSSPPLHPISRSSSSDEESTNRVSRRRENIPVGSRKRRRPQR